MSFPRSEAPIAPGACPEGKQMLGRGFPFISTAGNVGSTPTDCPTWQLSSNGRTPPQQEIWVQVPAEATGPRRLTGRTPAAFTLARISVEGLDAPQGDSGNRVGAATLRGISKHGFSHPPAQGKKNLISLPTQKVPVSESSLTVMEF